MSIIKNKNNDNKARAYYISGIIMVAASCAFPQTWICTAGFLLGMFVTVVQKKKISSILNFCIICLINRQVTVAPLYPGAGITLMSLVNVIVLLFFFRYILDMLLKKNKGFVIPVSFLLLWVCYRVLNGVYTGALSVIPSLWACVPLLLCLTLQYMGNRYKNYSNELFISVIVGCSLVVLVGYIELLISHTFFYSLWKYDVYRYGVLRVGSTLADPNFMSMVDLLFLCLLYTKAAKANFNKTFLAVFKVLTVFQIVLSFSRAAIIALAVCYLMAIILKKKGRLLLLIPILVLAALLIPYAMEQILSWGDTSMLVSTSSRLRIVEAAFNLWKTSPIMGLGNSAFYNNSAALIGTANVSTMNTFVQVLVEYGIIGMMFYISYSFVLVKKILGFMKNTVSTSASSYSLYIVALFGWLVMSFSLDTFQLVGFWMLPTLILAEHNIETLERSEESNI